MKRTLKITSLGVFLLLGFCVAIPCARADDLYAAVGVILKFDSNGNESVFANSGLDLPTGLAFDASGDLFVANGLSSTIEEFGPSGTGSVFATSASGISGPIGLAFDSSGNLFVANSANNTIEEINPDGTGSVFATAASGLNVPTGLAFDTSGNLYVANEGNYSIEKFSANGTGSVFGTASSGVANPYGLAFYGDNLYVANYANSNIEKFNASGIGSTFASFSTNGAGIYLIEPTGITFDSSGNLYVATGISGGRILEIDPEGDISVFASGFGDAAFLATQIPEPSSLLLSALGTLSLAAFLRRKRT